MKQLMTIKRFGGGLVFLLILGSAGCLLFYHVSLKLVALTFDDGPYGDATNQILDILKKEKVPATFFLLGINVEKYPAITKRIVNEGHVIGNHSYSHSESLSKMSTADFEADVRHAENLIVSVTGLQPRYFRPPFGMHTPSMDQQLKEMGYFVVLWDFGAGDFKQDTSSDTIVKRIIGNTLKWQKRREIILLHDGRDVQIGYPRQNVIQALPQLIKRLKKLHYRFVTLEQIIHQSPYH
jgi:peptidoglycan/xylan/chitin deacetylase (PgdA/CDA1 family)